VTKVRSPAPGALSRLGSEDFGRRVIEWQRHHGRHDLPWQRNRDPYAVWVSEIMLQQTQVATVIPYYERFLARFPDVAALARAQEDAVLQLWSGLGYYSRARNLHRAAQLLASRYDRRFPRDAQSIAELPGVGRSTAAAIAALAFGVRAPILDGNVKRVLCRAFGIDGDPGSSTTLRELWVLAEGLLPAHDIEAYTQGLMDLGATVCVRRTPKCGICPLRSDCVALQLGRIDELPRTRTRPPRPQRSVAMLVLRHASCVLLEKRPAAGIWGGLWCFPESDLDADLESLCAQRFGAVLVRVVPLAPLEHGFTHFRLRIHPLCIDVGRLSAARAAEPGALWLSVDEARAAAIPSPVRKLLEAL
jgi:A/G-specific adenine glycosylase